MPSPGNGLLTFEDKCADCKLQDLIYQKYGSDTKVLPVDMTHVLSPADYADNLHPNDSGYGKLANAWYDGLAAATGAGWINDPVAGTTHVACPNLPAWIGQGQISNGGGNGMNVFPSAACSYK